VCNMKASTIDEVWVEGGLRLSFRRTFSDPMMQRWDELMSIVEQPTLNEDIDALVWCYEKSGIYSSHSCYSIISYKGLNQFTFQGYGVLSCLLRFISFFGYYLIINWLPLII
jgi:hypothetical protein